MPAKRPKRPKPLSRAQTAAFLKASPVDTCLTFRVYDLAFAGQFRSLPDRDSYELRRIEPYLKTDLDLFLQTSLTDGCVDSAARMTALFCPPQVTIAGHREVKGVHVWKVRAKLKVALADPDFDAAAWARGATATLAAVEACTDHYTRKERWVPVELLGPMKVTARQTASVLALRSVTLTFAF
jgi:hypothetical protein